MNQQIQDIADKVEDNISAKATVSPDPARVSAADHAEILNDILVQLDTLVTNTPPVDPSGVFWHIPPGRPTITSTTVAETQSEVNNSGDIIVVPAQTVTFPLAASGKKRKDAIMASYLADPPFYYRAAGEEVDQYAIVVSPTLNQNDLFVRWVDVTASGLTQSPTNPVKSLSFDGGTPELPDVNGNIDIKDFMDEFIQVQDSLDYDGTGVKIPTVDAVNEAFTRNTKLFGCTGITHKNDTVELTVLNSTTIRITACTSALFWNELFVAGQDSGDAFKSFAQKDYLLTQLITATGGNINQNPLVADGLYVRYLGYDKNGNIVSSAANFLQDLSVVQLGFTTVIKSGSAVTFLGGTTPGARNVFSQPTLASSLELDRTLVELKSNIVIGYNTGAASLKSSSGSITGLSINWRGTGNVGNTLPIDKVIYTGVATLPFASINPLFLTTTTAPTAHTLWTETEGGIAINNRIFNTTTNLAATLDNNKFSVKRVLVGTRGGMWLQDGEHATTAGYATIDAARAALSSHAFTDSIVPPGVVAEIARIAFKKGVTDFSNANEFYITSTFNGAGGGGSGSTTFATLGGNPHDNAALGAELDALNALALASTNNYSVCFPNTNREYLDSFNDNTHITAVELKTGAATFSYSINGGSIVTPTLPLSTPITVLAGEVIKYKMTHSSGEVLGLIIFTYENY